MLERTSVFFFPPNIFTWMSKVLEVLFSDFLWYLKYLTPLFFPLKMTVKYLKIDQVLDINQVLDTLFFFLVLFYFFTLWQRLSSTCFPKKKRQVLDQVPTFFLYLIKYLMFFL